MLVFNFAFEARDDLNMSSLSARFCQALGVAHPHRRHRPGRSSFVATKDGGLPASSAKSFFRPSWKKFWLERAWPSVAKSSQSEPLNASSNLIACSSRPIPSFVPSNQTLEFRIVKDSTNSLRPLRTIPDNGFINSPTSSNWSPYHPNSINPQEKARLNSAWLDPTSTVDPIGHLRETIKLSRLSHFREENWTIRCTELNQNAEIVGSRSMSKSEICAQNRLQPRDLRKIDSRISSVVPSILVREEAIIFNVLNIRALIKANSILIFDNPGLPSVSITQSKNDSSAPPKYSIRSAFLHTLINKLSETRDYECAPADETRETQLPYEFRAIETMLSSVATTLESELGVLRTLVASVLDGLEQNIDREQLKQLLLYSRRLSAFNSRALLVQQCLDEILENDDDMAKAYLSEKNLKDSPRKSYDHEEFEQLLESFSKYVEEIVHEGKSILTNIKSTEEIIELILDSNRNTLLALDLKVSIATMGLGLGAFTAGLFGMNLRTSLESHPHAFSIVTGFSMIAVFIAVALGWRRLHRLRRVGLRAVNHHSRNNYLSWKRPNESWNKANGSLDWDVPPLSLKDTRLSHWKQNESRSM
ncbi:hypothetical protein O181_042141 [Austropuccinia psidii MF-1]|uniref:Magnesium transporter n=1 Tax=Austropuccinia psidii MF-1 TaxID=1389203 RepID=A0A9Q3DEB2_9BASI|nr:hypothetical protein [Austropuccinia psidii MF-1]